MGDVGFASEREDAAVAVGAVTDVHVEFSVDPANAFFKGLDEKPGFAGVGRGRGFVELDHRGTYGGELTEQRVDDVAGEGEDEFLTARIVVVEAPIGEGIGACDGDLEDPCGEGFEEEVFIDVIILLEAYRADAAGFAPVSVVPRADFATEFEARDVLDRVLIHFDPAGFAVIDVVEAEVFEDFEVEEGEVVAGLLFVFFADAAVAEDF